MQKIYLGQLIACLLFTSSACKRELIQSEATPVKGAQHLLSKNQINSHIINILNIKNDFKWADASPQIIWSALNYSNNVLSIGYKPQSWTNEQVDANLHLIDIESQEWQETKKQILRLVWEEERKNKPNLKIEELEIYQQKHLPAICVSVYNLNTVEKLRKSALIRYAEPMSYTISERQEQVDQLQGALSSLGCNRANPYKGVLANNIDYKLIQPNSKVSWNYAHHYIPEAWKTSNGKGVKVMVIDTGSSLNQENLQSQFNQGRSVGRTVEHLVTLRNIIEYYPGKFYEYKGTSIGRKHAIRDDSPEALGDFCGHGTMMAGVIAAPRGTDGNACGIAYNCDLVTVKATQDVFISTDTEILSVIDAFNLAANRPDIKIISMSLGTPFRESMLADAIKKAANSGKLIFCAAGTAHESFKVTKHWGVVFPASMPEVIAVTGIKDNLREACDVCHEGPEIDFVAVVQRSSKKFLSLTLATSGDIPAVDGGSSVATAMMAGMAAIVWSKYPNKSASEILRILKASSTNPNKNIYWGSGILDAYKALSFDGIFGPGESLKSSVTRPKY